MKNWSVMRSAPCATAIVGFISALISVHPAEAANDVPAETKVAPTDFARELIVPVASLETHDVPVPRAVYQTLTRSDRTDLCVFDESGVRVPFAWIPEPPHQEIRYGEAQTFRIPRSSAQGETSGIVIERTESGSLWVRRSDKASGVTAYEDILVDLGRDSEPLKVTLDWELPRGETVWNVELAASNDLLNFKPMGTRALTNISPEHRRIEVRASERGRYLRLRTDDPGFPAAVRLVRARLERTEALSPVPRQMEIPASRSETLGVYRFILDGQFPWTEATLRLRAPGARTEGVLVASPDGKGSWSQLLAGAFGGDGLAPKANIPSGTRVIEARFADKGSATTADPVLVADYAPLLVRFSPSGKVAHRIVFGSARARCEGIHSLAAETRSIRVGPLGEDRELGGPAVLVPIQVTEVKSKTWLLWSALCGAVLALSVLAFRLARELRRGG